MTEKLNLAPFVRRALPLWAVIACSTPAFADHLGPSGFGSGGGMSVFDPGTLDQGHWATGLRLTYTRPEQRPDVELAALASQHIHAHNTDYNLVAAVGVAYGITHHLTVSAELPYVRRDDLREGTHDHVGGVAVNGVEELGSVSGIGDLNLLAKYRLTEGTGPSLALIAGMKLPTGSTDRSSLGGERLETEHQPGTGSWDPIVGASASLPMGPLTLTASGIYQFSQRGSQDTRLGDRLQGGIALSHRFGAAPHMHSEGHNHHHGDELDEHEGAPKSSWDAFVELAGEWEGRQTIEGEVEDASGGKWSWIAPGVRYNAASGWSASMGVAIPVYQRIRASHPDNRFRLTLSLGRAF
jgi:hypothetical protein